MSERIRVVIVDDHLMVRRGLATFLLSAPDLELAGEAGSADEAIRVCAKTQPDVVLLDLMLPELDGVTAIRAIRQAHSSTQVIAVTSSLDEALVPKVLGAGAISYLLKDIGALALGDAIRAASAGRSTLAPEATRALMRRRKAPTSRASTLTERERDVLRLMVQGLSNPQIADRLAVSRSTVHSHVSSVFGKLQVTSRTHAVARALQDRLIN